MKTFPFYLICMGLFVTWQTYVGNFRYFNLETQNDDYDYSVITRAISSTDDIVPQRHITFIRVRKMITWAHAYSGMWWQHKRFVLSIDWEARFDKMPITASEKVLRNRARLTTDWMDFSVEHMSVLWKHFNFRKIDQDQMVFETIQETLDQYVANVQPDPIPLDSAAPSTIALLSFYGREDHEDVKLKESALTATLAGLWKIGIVRAVVVGNTEEEGRIVKRAFDALLERMIINPIELKYIAVTQVTKMDQRLMPKIALLGLQQAMNGQMSDEEAVEWLGSNDRGERFEFVYFSEEDLVLHTRPSAMKAIRDEMLKGGAITAHRFQPLPHERSLPRNYTRFDRILPDVGRFSNITTLDITAGDACCDVGKYYPHNPENKAEPVQFFPCRGGLSFWRCGFFKKQTMYKNEESLGKLHKYIPEVIVRIEGGTGFPLINNHQKVCNPGKIGDCD